MTRTVVVTGATAGIGAGIVHRLVTDGWHVVAAGRRGDRLAELAERHGESLDTAVLDVRDHEAVAELIASTSRRHGLDAWVNNAGISQISPFLDIPLEQYHDTIATNLTAPFVATQQVARAMIASGTRGGIVNIASMASKQGKAPLLADYIASKFGVLGLTQASALELGVHGIRVNAVCPGYIATDMQTTEEAAESALTGEPIAAIRQRYVDEAPLARVGTVEEVAAVVSFLLSPDARFLTGESIAVNGGVFMD